MINRQSASFGLQAQSLVLFVLCLFVCHGCAEDRHTPVKSGWKRIHWNAGDGSWFFGGAGVAYDLDIPSEYTFTNKLGRAYIMSDSTSSPLIVLNYWTSSMKTSVPYKDAQGNPKVAEVSPDADFKKFVDASNSLAAQYPAKYSQINVGAAREVTVNGIPFQRIDLSCEAVPKFDATQKMHYDGFRLKGQNIDVTVGPVETKDLKTSEEIINSLHHS